MNNTERKNVKDWKLLAVRPSRGDIANKRYVAIFEKTLKSGKKKEKKVGFGLPNPERRKITFTDGASNEKREAYLERHAVDLKTNNPKKAGYLAYYILWSGFEDELGHKPSQSLVKNVLRYKKMFDL